MVEAVPIKVLIGLRPNGEADHPDWAQLPLQATGGERHEDHQIVKWKYDKTSGHDEATLESPRGQQFGMMLVTQLFADQAVAMFPALVSVMTAAEAEDFWDNKAHAHLADEARNSAEISALHAEFILIRDLATEFPGNAKLQNRLSALKTLLQKALDPDDATPGVVKNKLRRWADAKLSLDVTIKP